MNTRRGLTLLVLVTAIVGTRVASKSVDDVEVNEEILERVKRVVSPTADIVQRGKWPWLVHLKAKVCKSGARQWYCLWLCRKKTCKTVTCGGSIVDNRYVLTAAHCVDDNDATYRRELRKSKAFHVTSGEVDWGCSTADYIRHLWARLTGNVANRCHIHATTVTVHPEYQRGRSTYWNYDFALLRLEADVLENDNTGTIDLPPAGTNENWPSEGAMGYVHGWGCTMLGGRPVSRARNSEIRLRSNGFCRSAFNSRYDIRTHICAGGGGISVCNGDSGGPLVVERNGRYFQAGVVSFFVEDEEFFEPSGFGRTSAAMPWIRRIVPNV